MGLRLLIRAVNRQEISLAKLTTSQVQQRRTVHGLAVLLGRV